MNQTTCPHCGHRFDAGEALQKHLDIELRKKIEEQEKLNAQKLEEYKKQIAEEKRQFEQEEKKKMWAIAQSEAKKRVEEANSAQIQALKEENEQKQKQILASQQKELELLRRETELKNQQDQLRIQLEKDMLQKRQEIEEAARKKEEERFELIKKEYEKRLEDQVKLVDEMKRKAEQGSMQMQGEVQELALEELLQAAFPYDEIQEVGKGIRGADVIQIVRNELGQDCGKIIYESKRTQNFGGDWIDKLKDDQRNIGADIAVLVTQTMPKDMERFGEKDGVWVCNFLEMKALVFALRKILIQTQTVKSSQENRADKMAVMYSYLTSNQFKQQIEAIVDGFKTLKDDLDREKRAFQKIWKEREATIEKVLGSTIDMYGSMRGIAGKAIDRIQYLELPGADDED
ncbi:MAG: DUF2130 domain-containing protein [Spirosomaceae bacterium]|nr:DUF2130 domain-containing protein [Spirosomataceae bacterium]